MLRALFNQLLPPLILVARHSYTIQSSYDFFNNIVPASTTRYVVVAINHDLVLSIVSVVCGYHVQSSALLFIPEETLIEGE